MVSLIVIITGVSGKQYTFRYNGDLNDESHRIGNICLDEDRYVQTDEKGDKTTILGAHIESFTVRKAS